MTQVWQKHSVGFFHASQAVKVKWASTLDDQIRNGHSGQVAKETWICNKSLSACFHPICSWGTSGLLQDLGKEAELPGWPCLAVPGPCQILGPSQGLILSCTHPGSWADPSEVPTAQALAQLHHRGVAQSLPVQKAAQSYRSRRLQSFASKRCRGASVWSAGMLYCHNCSQQFDYFSPNLQGYELSCLLKGRKDTIRLLCS